MQAWTLFLVLRVNFSYVGSYCRYWPGAPRLCERPALLLLVQLLLQRLINQSHVFVFIIFPRTKKASQTCTSSTRNLFFFCCSNFSCFLEKLLILSGILTSWPASARSSCQSMPSLNRHMQLLTVLYLFSWSGLSWFVNVVVHDGLANIFK